MHLNEMEITPFYENKEIHCSKRKNFAMFAFILFFFLKMNAVGSDLKAMLLKND